VLVAGVALLALYMAAWHVLIRSGVLANMHIITETSGDPEVVDAQEAAEYYEVTTRTGDVYVERIVGNKDPAHVLIVVAKRYGEGASLRRLEPEQGRARIVSTTRLQPWLRALFLFPVGLLITGLYLRRRSDAAKRVWRLLAPTLCADAAFLQREAGLARWEVRDAARDLTKRGVAQLEFHALTERIFDKRLNNFYLPLNRCPQCKGQINLRVRADLNELPRCTACKQILDRAALEPLTARVAKKIRDEAPRPSRLTADFSLGWFAFWVLLWPPIAMLYALRTGVA
jgi:hypothetical protein